MRILICHLKNLHGQCLQLSNIILKFMFLVFSMETDMDMTDEVQDPKVFDGLTTWFSTSVSNDRKKLWCKHCLYQTFHPMIW